MVSFISELLYPKGVFPQAHCVGRQVGLRISSDAMEKTNISAPTRIQIQFFLVATILTSNYNGTLKY